MAADAMPDNRQVISDIMWRRTVHMSVVQRTPSFLLARPSKEMKVIRLDKTDYTHVNSAKLAIELLLDPSWICMSCVRYTLFRKELVCNCGLFDLRDLSLRN
jgi:hypothetical protein